jgi:hypothetical protein
MANSDATVKLCLSYQLVVPALALVNLVAIILQTAQSLRHWFVFLFTNSGNLFTSPEAKCPSLRSDPSSDAVASLCGWSVNAEDFYLNAGRIHYLRFVEKSGYIQNWPWSEQLAGRSERVESDSEW